MKMTLAVAAALTLVVGAGTAWAGSSAPSVTVANPSLNVNVTNNPLPVSVTNATANQNVTVTNSATNPVPVTMANPIDLVKAKLNAHFQVTLVRGANPNGNFCSNQYIVPTGKRLLVSQVAFRVVAPTANMMGGEIDLQASGALTFQTYFNAVPAVVTTVTGTPRNQFQGAQAVDVTADGGNTVEVGVVLSPVDLLAGCDFSIVGLLVDSP